jgi:hypothetical protein
MTEIDRKPWIMHARTAVEKLPIATVAFTVVPVLEGHRFFFGFSTCSAQDSPRKSTGVAKALGRLQSARVRYHDLLTVRPHSANLLNPDQEEVYNLIYDRMDRSLRLVETKKRKVNRSLLKLQCRSVVEKFCAARKV